MKLEIFHGKEKPLTAVGSNQVRLLEFAFKYPKWHSYYDNAANRKAVAGLLKRGSIVVNEFNQFKINM